MKEGLAERFRRALLQRGLQPTERRLAVAIAMEGHRGHPTLHELAVSLGEQALSEITVYRTLKLLEEAGLVDRLVLDGQTRFEPVGPHHDHFVCVDCGAVTEFHDEAIEARQAEVAAANGFRIQGHRHVIRVRCGCRDDAGEARRE